LARAYRWAYVPDLANRHPEFTLTVSAFCRLRYGAFQGSLENEYGRAVGPNAPSDAWELFHRWFPRYRLDQPVRADRLGELQTLIRCVERMYGAPFLIKNNNNATRIPHLRAAFPEAIWIHVRRDDLATAESLLEARRRFGVGLNGWWSAAPPPYWSRTFTDEFEQVAHQVVGVEAAITADLASLDPRRLVEVSYESLCQDPQRFAAEVASRYAGAGVLLKPLIPPPDAIDAIQPSSRSADDRRRLAAALATLRAEHT
jgi:hypothetical protein